MPNINYVAQGLDGEQIEAALTAIDGVVSQENNGKVLAIENGKIVAKSASEWTDTPVLEPLSVTANGDYVPGSGVDGFNAVHVAVPGAGTIEPLSVTQNGTYSPPSGVDGYAPVTVNVQSGYTFESLDYCEFDGKQKVIILPVFLTKDTQTETDFMVTGAAQDQVVSGTWDNTQSGNITWTRIICENSSIYIGNGTFNGQVSKVAQWQNVRHVVKTNVDGQLWLDEEAIGAYVSYQPTRDIPLSVGGSHMTTTHSPFVGRIYSYKVSNAITGTIVCNLQPKKLSIPSFRIVYTGLYDEVTGKFFVVGT